MTVQSSKKNAQELGFKQQEVASVAQKILIHLVDLNSQVKQAHWNIEGAGFLSFHKQLDDVYSYFEEAIDELAERIRALGEPADGAPKTIVRESELEVFPDGLVTVNNAMKILSSRLNFVSLAIRDALEEVEDLDPISHDMLIEICTHVEKFKWLIDSQIVS
ncbi:MAG: DNA starvation/stationary phase protection protein [Pirellulales bacterium]